MTDRWEKQDVPDTNVEDMVSKKAVELALIEKGWSSKRYKIGEIWELNADEIREALAAVPSAQPEIIRCRDCKHLQKWRSEESVKKFGQIYECEKNVLDCPKPEDFCSRAERRTNG